MNLSQEGEQNQLVLQRKSQKVALLIGSLKTLFRQHPYSAHLLLRARSNIQHDEHRDYPAAYNNLPFAFEEPLFCCLFPNISIGFPAESHQARQGHWLLILWGLGPTMCSWIQRMYNWEQEGLCVLQSVCCSLCA